MVFRSIIRAPTVKPIVIEMRVKMPFQSKSPTRNNRRRLNHRYNI